MSSGVLASRLLPTRMGFQVGEVSLAESAQRARVCYRTWARYVERWAMRGVEGIGVVRCRARAGRRYVVDPSVVERYLSCDLTP